MHSTLNSGKQGTELSARRLFAIIQQLKESATRLPKHLSVWLLLTAAMLLLAPPALAISTGNAANGATAWTAKGCNGCHTLTAGDNRFNAANASNVIAYAIAQNFGGAMGAQTPNATEQDDIAAYIASVAAYTATDPKVVTVPQNTATGITINNLNFNVAPDPNPFNAIATQTAPAHGTVSYAIAAGVATATYTPTAGYTGADTFTYQASGAAGTSNIRTINITVSAGPTVSAAAATTAYNTAVAVDLTSSIVGAGITAVTVVGGPATAHGTTSVAGKVITYTPNAGYSGTDTFSYTATNAGGTSGSAVVTITITPAASGATMTVPLNTPTQMDLAPYMGGTSITGVNIVTAAAHGTITVNGTKVTYTPNTNYFGSDSFVYQGFGAGGTTPNGTVTVNVTGRPDPTQDRNVTALLSAQVDSAKRFAKAQIANFQQHMESLHRRFNPENANGARIDQDARRLLPGQNPNQQTPALAPRSAPLINNDWQATKARQESLQQAAQLGDPLRAENILNSPNEIRPQTMNGAQGISQGLAALGLTGINTNSLNLNALAVGTGMTSPAGVSSGIWIAGNVRFGTRSSDANPTHFLTDGVTMGYDRSISNDLTIGVGVSYARDRSMLNNDGSTNRMDGASAAVYASYLPSPNTFVDGVLGYGTIKNDSHRYVSAASSFAQSQRRGDQMFGSLAAGYEYRSEGLLFSPYGRLDFSYSRLDSTSETGAGLYALNYSAQNARTAQVALGLRAEATHQADFGILLPHARIEYQRGLESSGPMQLRYADQLSANGYQISATTSNRNSFVLGLGSDLLLNNGLRLSVDYQTLRSIGGENSQAVSLRLYKEFDGPGLRNRSNAYSEFSIPTLGISVDGGYTYDDNVSRAVNGPDKYSDESYTVNLRKNWRLQITDNTRLVLNTFFGGEKFHTYTGLSHLTLGGQAEYQYRTSGDFMAPTFGAFARLAGENYQSNMRDGFRWSSGLTIRQPITDRIGLFGALSYNYRNANNPVFDSQDYSARINVDYQITSKSSLYFTGEYRLGDVVSSGQGTIQNLDTAKVFARDDVFISPQLFDYRFKGRSTFTTLGYSLPLGPTDALDFSWRRVRSSPLWEPSYVSRHAHYTDNQFSFSYLTRF